MKHLQSAKLIILSLMVLASLTSCSKDEINTDGQVAGITVKLKSSTSAFKSLFLEIEDVQIKVKEDGNLPNAWISLNAINTGAHNVSDLKEHSELLLVDFFEIKSTYIHEIRLVLGENNFIDINKTLYSLDVKESGNAKPSNLVKTELLANRIYDFIIDINISESISFNDDESMMILNPKLYTEIRQFQY